MEGFRGFFMVASTGLRSFGDGQGGLRRELPLGALDREILGRVVEGDIKLAWVSGADVVDSKPDRLTRAMDDLDPLTFFSSENQHK